MSNRSRHHRFCLAAFAALALLIGQLGAMAHSYTHHLPTAKMSAKQQQANSHAICDDCLNFAPLLAAVGAADALPFLAPSIISVPAPTAPDSFRSHRTFLAFRSRAPPLTH